VSGKIIGNGDEFVAILGAEETVSSYDTGRVFSVRKMKDATDVSIFNTQNKRFKHQHVTATGSGAETYRFFLLFFFLG
jgi:hypothetical protein